MAVYEWNVTISYLIITNKKEKKLGVSRFPAPECRWRPVCWRGWGQGCPGGGMGLCALTWASGWPHLAREAPSAEGTGQGTLSWVFWAPSLCSPDISHEPQHPPGKLLSLIISVSLQWCFFGLFCIWAHWCKTCHSHRGNHVTIEPLIKEIILDTWGNSCKALSDFQCIYFIHVILEVFLLWGMGMAVSVLESGQYKRKIFLISEMLPVLGRPQYSRNILFLCSAVPLTSHSLGFVFSFCVERQMGLVLHSKIFKV